MAATFEITAISRENNGKAHARRMRRMQNLVPAVVYGADQPTQSICLKDNEISKALSNEAFASHILTLKIDGKAQKVVLKEVQRHPARNDLLHIDFFRISEKEKIIMSVPLHFIGGDECPGVKDGGKVSHLFNELEIRCLPADLPENIEIDISNLALNDAIHMSQLKLPKGVEILSLAQNKDDAHDQAVVSVHIPKIVEEPEESSEQVSAEVPTVAETESEETEDKE